MTGQEIVDLGKKHLGEQYILGSIAPKDNPDYTGPWDCAEFVSWLVFQITGKLYGTVNDNTTDPSAADAGTIYWANEVAKGNVTVVSVDEAASTIGGILLREAGEGLDGHIVVALGDGRTVEAHGHADGVVINIVAGRRWTHGILIPGVDYLPGKQLSIAPVQVLQIGIDNDLDAVMAVQNQLVNLGYDIGPSGADGLYGQETFDAIVKFQDDHALKDDGEVGPATKAALGL